MSWVPGLKRAVVPSGETRFELGHRLVDRYLAFVAGRARPNTVRAAAFDLKAFFTVVGKDPLEVTSADVLDFIAAQRGDRTVVRLADRESGWACSGLTDIHHQGRCPGEDARHEDHGTKASCPSVLHPGVQG